MELEPKDRKVIRRKEELCTTGDIIPAADYRHVSEIHAWCLLFVSERSQNHTLQAASLGGG